MVAPKKYSARGGGGGGGVPCSDTRVKMAGCALPSIL
jgi:hypothetical protein